MKLCSRSPVNI